jgi:hypothetical protein
MKFIKILVFKDLFVQMPRSKPQPVLQLTQIAPPKAMFEQMQTPLSLQSITMGLNAQQHRHAGGHAFKRMVPVDGVAQQSIKAAERGKGMQLVAGGDASYDRSMAFHMVCPSQSLLQCHTPFSVAGGHIGVGFVDDKSIRVRQASSAMALK